MDELKKIKEHFEANMLDGDNVGSGWSISDITFLQYLQEFYILKDNQPDMD